MISKALFTQSLLTLSCLAAVTTAQAQERLSLTDWKRAFTQAITQNDSKKAAQLVDFKDLEKTALPACVDCSAKEKMLKARQVFSQGKHGEAAELYAQIPKTSDLWLQSVEERGWAFFRQDDYEKSLAQVKTLLSPQFTQVVNDEAFFLQALSQLRICDYAGVLETTKKYKDTQRERLVKKQDLAKTGSNADVEAVLASVNSFPLTLADLGKPANNLPVLFYRDNELQKSLLQYKIAQTALEVLSSSGKMPALQKNLAKTEKSNHGKIKKRLMELAQQDIDSSALIIQKLNLVEVEAIQRIHTDLAASQDMYQQNEFQKVNSDKLVFKDDGQPWIDELDKYEVSAKVCHKGIRRKM